MLYAVHNAAYALWRDRSMLSSPRFFVYHLCDIYIRVDFESSSGFKIKCPFPRAICSVHPVPYSFVESLAVRYFHVCITHIGFNFFFFREPGSTEVEIFVFEVESFVRLPSRWKNGFLINLRRNRYYEIDRKSNA